MIWKNAHKATVGLLLILITVLAVACSTVSSDRTPTPSITTGIHPAATPGNTQQTTVYSYHPNITIGPRRGKAGTEVTVVGGGFPAGIDVQIRLTGEDTGAPDDYIAQTEAGQHGNIQASFTMPANWPSGEPITIPRVTILASTTDFAEKATTVFVYETNVTPEVTPAAKSTPLAP